MPQSFNQQPRISALPPAPIAVPLGASARPHLAGIRHLGGLKGAGDGRLGLALIHAGEISAHDMIDALAVQARERGKLADILLARGHIRPERYYPSLARLWATSLIDLAQSPPDLALVDAFGAADCLRHAIIPWRCIGGTTLVATARPEDFDHHRPTLEAMFGKIAMVITPQEAVEQSILSLRGHRLVHDAENRLPAAASCRDFGGARLHLPLILAAFVIASLIFISPALVLWLLVAWAVITLTLSCALKMSAGIAAGLRRPPVKPPPGPTQLPVVSVMVALYRESDIAPRLVRRLSRLDYPRDKLDVVLVVEEEDQMTRTALAQAEIPAWMRVIVVPGGQVKTKPRALNFALDYCRGAIVGVYDAEDAPDPDQIRKVATRFAQCPPQVACLQGILDFYNPTTNWLSRCFTIEYATWFRLVLPGLQRLGLPIPLGGTTLFFRREILERLGGWDAHNVTEDADLGMRLYRMGYRTELIPTVTGEEANCRPLPWVKQRSRWLKGYMMTWATHMRDPALLWRQLGPWRFAGFQVLFLCTLSQFLLVPVLWSFWLALFGLPHPVADALPPGANLALMGLFLITEVVNISMGVMALRATGHRFSPLWVLSLHFYFPLGALASYKAAGEVVRAPFYWDKTTHGHFDPPDT